MLLDAEHFFPAPVREVTLLGGKPQGLMSPKVSPRGQLSGQLSSVRR